MAVFLSKKTEKVWAKVLLLVMAFTIIFGSFTPTAMVNAEGSNLVINPGFEEGTTTPSSWIPAPTFENLMVWDSSTFHTGQKSLKLTTSASTKRSIYDQKSIPVKAGSKYNLEAYCKVSGFSGSGLIYVYFYDASGKTLGSTSGAVVKTISDWQKVGKTDIVAPALSSTAMIRLMILSDTTQGSVWYDDISLTEVVVPQKTLASVTAASGKDTLIAGQTTQLSVTAKWDTGENVDLSAAGASINYTSDNQQIATVSSSGAITAVIPGTCNVTASVKIGDVTKEGSVAITVSDKTLNTVTVTAEKTQLYVGETTALVVSAALSDGTGVDLNDAAVSYTSSNAEAASVSTKGAIAALGIGTTTITAEVTLGNFKKSSSIDIQVNKPILAAVKISCTRTEILPEQTMQLAVSGTMTNGAADMNKAVISYSSDKPDVATVDANGLVKGIKTGVANITASVTLDEITKQTTVAMTIVQQIQEETIIYDFHKLGLTGQEKQDNWDIAGASCGYIPYATGIVVQAKKVGDYIDINFLAPQTSPYMIQMVGTATKYAALGSILVDGQAVGDFNFYNTEGTHDRIDGVQKTLGYVELSQGAHKFTLQVKAKQTDYSMYPTQFIIKKVNMIPELAEVSMQSDKSELITGQTAKLAVAGIMNTGDPADFKEAGTVITYSSDAPGIAAVASTGIVTAVGIGTANIKAVVKMQKVVMEASLLITVSGESLASVAMTAEKLQIPVGTSTKLIVSGTRTDGKALDLIGDKMIFKSSSAEILTVDNSGVVKGVSKGKATVTVDVTIGAVTKSTSVEIEVLTPELDKLSLSGAAPVVAIGSTTQLRLSALLNNGKPADLTQAEIIYTSDKPNVVAVSNDGKIKAIAEGAAVVTAKVTLNSIIKEASINVEVQDSAKIKNAKTRATYYTDARVAAARQNIQKYDWAKATKNKAVAEAEKYTALSDEDLWSMVTPQSIPRTMYYIQRTKTLVCPSCGKDISTIAGSPYPWTMNPISDPWKLTCPGCKAKFPTNDFGAYYKSGLDEHGIFNRDLADKKFLVNTLYPEKGTTWGVDDGNGWKDANGNVFTFIAYYNHWALWYGEQGSWGIIQKAIKALRDAYVYTGDVKYAHSGIILLDRIADVYPDMDIAKYLWKDGFDNGQPTVHTCQGKILNDIWETFMAKDFASAYDAFFPALKDGDAANVLPFLTAKADQYSLGVNKYSVNGIKKNIEDNILRQVLPAVKDSQIRGNQGMHQSALAMAAVVLDEEGTTQEMLDFNFKSGGLEVVTGSQYPNGRKYIITGGNVLGVLTNDVDRDGFGYEAAPGYNYLWIGQMTDVADVLDGYDRYPKADMYHNPSIAGKLCKMFKGTYPLVMVGKYIPTIGDSGGTGLAGLSFNADLLVKAYEKFGDPEFAQAAYMINNKSAAGLHGGIFSKDSETIAQKIQEVVNKYGQMELKSDNLTGFGLAALRDGADNSVSVGYEYDFLQMSIDATSGKEYKQVAGPALFYRSAGAGDFITFKFSVTKAAEYDIRLVTMLSPIYGMYNIKVDGQIVGAPYDAYASQLAESDLKSIGRRVLAEGEHTITFECAGKNESSTNYVIALKKLALLDLKQAEEVENNKEKYQDTRRDVWVYYGRNNGHGHADTLNLGVHAFGMDLAPDLGYPDKMDNSARRVWWTSNTISHNTVMVDKQKQKSSWVGTPTHFDENENVSLVDIEAPKVYTQTDMYKRTTAQIKVDGLNSYTVDFFRVSGGNDHHFSFHSNDANVTTEGLNLETQTTGTYAGANIEFGAEPSGSQAGFSFLKDVQRDSKPAEAFSIDWQQKKDTNVHLRLTMLGKIDDAALAVGEPPLTNTSNPKSLNYFIAHRQGENLDSMFTSVIEPYKGERYIESISPAGIKCIGKAVVDNMSVKAVKVVLKNGRTDYIISSLNPSITYIIDNKILFKGSFGVYSEIGGKKAYSYVNDGEISGILLGVFARLNGTVVDFTKEMSPNNKLIVKLDNPIGSLLNITGRYIYVSNDGERNAVYEIKGVKRLGINKLELDIGDATLVRKWLDPGDYSKGYVYDVAKDAKFVIPLSYSHEWLRPGKK